jgi:hypothetical protein
MIIDIKTDIDFEVSVTPRAIPSYSGGKAVNVTLGDTPEGLTLRVSEEKLRSTEQSDVLRIDAPVGTLLRMPRNSKATVKYSNGKVKILTGRKSYVL